MKNVLIFDPSHEIRLAIKEYLRGQAYFYEAQDLIGALWILNTFRIDLVVSDFSGTKEQFETFQLVLKKAHPKVWHIIFSSRFHDRMGRSEVLQADYYFYKPDESSAFFLKIFEILD